MSLTTKPAGNRREFFRATTRYGLLSLLTAAAVVVRQNRPAGQTCVNRGLCRGCAVFSDCGLPRALSAKRVLGGQS